MIKRLLLSSVVALAFASELDAGKRQYLNLRVRSEKVTLTYYYADTGKGCKDAYTPHDGWKLIKASGPHSDRIGVDCCFDLCDGIHFIFTVNESEGIKQYNHRYAKDLCTAWTRCGRTDVAEVFVDFYYNYLTVEIGSDRNHRELKHKAYDFAGNALTDDQIAEKQREAKEAGDTTKYDW